MYMEKRKTFLNKKLFLNSYNNFDFIRKAMKCWRNNTEVVCKMIP